MLNSSLQGNECPASVIVKQDLGTPAHPPW